MPEKIYVTMPVYMLMMETEKGKIDVFGDMHVEGTEDKMSLIFSGMAEARSYRDSSFPGAKVFKFSKESALANHLENLCNHQGLKHVGLDPTKRNEGGSNVGSMSTIEFVRWLRRNDSDNGVLAGN